MADEENAKDPSRHNGLRGPRHLDGANLGQVQTVVIDRSKNAT